MAIIPGTRIGAYEVTAQIGEGGMGVVLRARDTKLLRDVALKVLPVEPKWRRDSRELYYLAFDGKLMSVAVKPDGTFGTPVPLFETGLAVNRAQPDRTRRYDVAPHGHF